MKKALKKIVNYFYWGKKENKITPPETHLIPFTGDLTGIQGKITVFDGDLSEFRGNEVIENQSKPEK
jgi:hypothetical protein